VGLNGSIEVVVVVVLVVVVVVVLVVVVKVSLPWKRLPFSTLQES